ncbi:MAG: hypothetical protein HGB19_04175 [Chlorobiales bacterium]|jgi:hypothetical protein|nr:hypothetical protein [Chlorobiales bacterium]
MVLLKRVRLFICCFLGCVCLFFLITPALAQRVSQSEAIGSGIAKLYTSVQNGGIAFGGLSIKTTRINGVEGIMFGVRGAWRVSGDLQVGVAAYKLMNQGYNTRFEFEGYQTRLKIMYGGVEVGYSFNYDRNVHLSFYTLVGLGMVRYSVEDGYGGDLGRDYFYVVEPGVNLEMNMTDRFRISVGGSYRIANGVNYYNLRDSNLSGLASTISFKFGMF